MARDATIAERLGPDAATRGLLRVAIVGHVDHGKSTLVGRLLHETGALPRGKVEAVAEMCRRRGMPFEWAFVTDALQAERDQGVTIDAGHIRFSTKTHDCVLIDAPGHREFIRNMISGSSDCDAALVTIDVTEGVCDQSRRHGLLLHLLGIGQIAVVMTKMDLAGYDERRFAEVEHDVRVQFGELGVEPSVIIPVSGREGDNVAALSTRTGWYRGPTVLQALDRFVSAAMQVDLPLRIPVQDVYRFDERRIVVGRVESGRIAVGEEVLFSPSNRTGRVKSIESWTAKGGAPAAAAAGECVGFTLEDQVFVERGEVVSHAGDAPVESNVFRARIFWLGDRPLKPGNRYTLRHNTAETAVQVESLDRVIDAGRLGEIPDVGEAARDCVADAVLRSRNVLALDPAAANSRTGRIVLADGFEIVGGGLIDMTGYPDQRRTTRSTNVVAVEHRVTPAARAQRTGHEGGVLWFTGLSGAGKSTLAIELEHRLFDEGYAVYVLDGDNLRHGLNADLGFSPKDRAENIRRVGEVAALFAHAGTLAISAFISPYRSNRERARKAAGAGFHEIYVKAGVDVCEQRDPKGLYARARRGEIAEFTGVSAPYEPPETCELIVDTARMPVEDSVAVLLDYVRRAFPLRR